MHRLSLLGVALLSLALALGGVTAPQSDAASADTALAADSVAAFPYVSPVAPGEYTGPGDGAIPPGWSPWTKDNHRQCGELRLVFANKDLKEDSDGILHAQGQFFIQFQAVGERAADITRFSFSFGKTTSQLHENPMVNCQEALPDNPAGKGTAGVYIPFYRSDFNPDDGFFIPVETRNVPDGQYAAAVHAYTGQFPDYIEVARAWALADVVNCAGTGTDYCNGADYDEDETVIGNDHTQPWMWVLPGDGQQTNDVNGLTIEILEPVESVRATINGEELPLTEWTPPPRDRDVLPMNDDTGCPTNVHPVCNHMVYSHGWQWQGMVNEGDLIFVEATDRNGNYVFKSMYWDGTGGTYVRDEPDIRFNPVTNPSQTINAGDTQRFDLRIENLGGGEAHVDFLFSPYDEEAVQAAWEDMSYDHGHATHIHLGVGEIRNTYVDIATTPETPRGVYKVTALLEYPAGGEYQQNTVDLELTVEGFVEPVVENETDDEPVIEDSPLPAAVAIVGAGLVALMAAARRRRAS